MGLRPCELGRRNQKLYYYIIINIKGLDDPLIRQIVTHSVGTVQPRYWSENVHCTHFNLVIFIFYL